jgi:hypothetical protein
MNALIVKIECDEVEITGYIVRMDRYGVNLWCAVGKHAPTFSG